MAKLYDILPKLEYNGVTITDITSQFALVDMVESLSNQYTQISISEGKTAEMISYDVYGTTNWWWIIYLANGVIDPFYDWLMSEQEVYYYCEKLYGDINGIHHWEDTEFNVYETDTLTSTATLIPITNLEYEIHRNDQKRRINIINASDIIKIESELKEYIKQMKKNKRTF